MKSLLICLALTLTMTACSPDAERVPPVDPQVNPAVDDLRDESPAKAIEAAAEAVSLAAEQATLGASGKDATDPVVVDPTTITVHKTATCGCCSAWVDHLRANDFEVRVVDHPDLGEIKKEFGVPQHLHSCHTGEVNGLFVEGHVPASDIRRMLELASQDQSIEGIAVPGMPMGSPGMEAGGMVQPYDVIMVAGEEESVLNSHGTP